jgi:hypothetical protein
MVHFCKSPARIHVRMLPVRYATRQQKWQIKPLNDWLLLRVPSGTNRNPVTRTVQIHLPCRIFINTVFSLKSCNLVQKFCSSNLVTQLCSLYMCVSLYFTGTFRIFSILTENVHVILIVFNRQLDSKANHSHVYMLVHHIEHNMHKLFDGKYLCFRLFVFMFSHDRIAGNLQNNIYFLCHVQ